MKKVLCVCAAALMIAALSTSCNKKCECKTYVNGALVGDATTFEVENGKKCKDYNSTVTLLGQTSETKCKTTF